MYIYGENKKQKFDSRIHTWSRVRFKFRIWWLDVFCVRVLILVAYTIGSENRGIDCVRVTLYTKFMDESKNKIDW